MTLAFYGVNDTDYADCVKYLFKERLEVCRKLYLERDKLTDEEYHKLNERLDELNYDVEFNMCRKALLILTISELEQEILKENDIVKRIEFDNAISNGIGKQIFPQLLNELNNYKYKDEQEKVFFYKFKWMLEYAINHNLNLVELDTFDED